MPRTAATARALRRFALTWAWDRAYHVVSQLTPGATTVTAEARRLLARGWVEAKLAERHGHLVVEAEAAPIARTAPVIRREIEDLENRDRLGVPGLARLGQLRAELHAAQTRA